MPIAEDRLNYFELLRVSWLIAWRYLALASLFGFVGTPVLSLGVTGVLTTIGVPAEIVLSAVGVMAFLLPPLIFYPLIIQMMLNKEFQGFEIQTVDRDDLPSSFSLGDSIGPAFFLAVLGILLGLPFGVALLFLFPVHEWPAWVHPAGGLLWATAVVYPIVLRLMFRRRFGSFRFVILRPADSAGLGAPGLG